MRYALFALLIWIHGTHLSVGATLLAHYSGGASPTSTAQPVDQQWVLSSNSNTYVAGASVLDAGVPAWSIHDPGTASLNAQGTPWANLTYAKHINAATTQQLLSQGWTISGRLKVVPEVSSGVSYDAGSNIWLGFIHVNPNDVPNRWFYAFTFGKTADGRTRVGLQGLSGFSLILDPTYHDYSMTYDPVSKKANVYVDGIFQIQYGGAAVVGGGANGQSMIYWGDNGSQTQVQAPRTTYYQSVQLMLVPEPSSLPFLGLALAGLLGSRRRGNRRDSSLSRV